MKKFMQEFKTFALRGNVMDMAVGVIIGSAFSGIVTSLTDNFINPILNLVTGGATYTLQDVASFASSFLTAVVNFLVMAFVLFCLLKGMNKLASLAIKKRRRPPRQRRRSAVLQDGNCNRRDSRPHCTSQLLDVEKP